MPRNLWSKRQQKLLDTLRQVRADAGVTQAQVAEAMGLRQSDVSKIEMGDRRMDLLEATDYAKACGMTLAQFARRLEKQLDSD